MPREAQAWKGCEPRSRILKAVPQQVSEDLNCLTKQSDKCPAYDNGVGWEQAVRGGRSRTLWPGFPSCRTAQLLALSTEVTAAVPKFELPICPLCFHPSGKGRGSQAGQRGNLALVRSLQWLLQILLGCCCCN